MVNEINIKFSAKYLYYSAKKQQKEAYLHLIKKKKKKNRMFVIMMSCQIYNDWKPLHSKLQ